MLCIFVNESGGCELHRGYICKLVFVEGESMIDLVHSSATALAAEH